MEIDVSPDDPSAVWSQYGLTQSPYSTSPLRLIGPLPIKTVFHGREREARTLKGNIRSSTSSRQIISGPVGVGKTSLANYVRWYLTSESKQNRYLTLQSEIRADPSWTSNDFLLELLSHLAASDDIFGWTDQYTLDSLVKIKEFVSITRDHTASAQLGPIGGGGGSTKTLPNRITNTQAEHLITSFLTEIRDSKKELIIVIDNIESMTTTKLAEFLLSLRDFLQSDGLHSVFVGTHKILPSIDRYGQVSSIFNSPLSLTPLSTNEFLQILNKRCNALTIKGSHHIKPYEEQTARALYETFKNVRFVFKVLQDATDQLRDFAPQPVTMERVRIVQEKERQRIESDLTELQSRIVHILIKQKEPLRIGELAKRADVYSTNITKYVEPLHEKGIVVIEEDPSDRRARLVRIPTNSYLQLQFATDTIQTKLN